MTTCPNSTASGCKCPEHYQGLRAHARDLDAYDKALNACRGPVILSIVTLGPDADEQPCTGTMLCTCARCIAQRAALLNTPRREVRQPWEPRRASAA